MEAILKQTTRDFSKTSEKIQTIIIALLAFLVPTFLAQLSQNLRQLLLMVKLIK